MRVAPSHLIFPPTTISMFASLARQYPHAQLVYRGGSGLIAPDPDLSTAAVARQALSSIGVPVDRMVFEDKSRTTHENAIEATALVHPTNSRNGFWLPAPSICRAPSRCFRKAGWDVFPVPASYMTDGKFSFRLRFALATICRRWI